MKRLRELFKVFWFGVREGYEDGRGFGCGLTWSGDQGKNEAYDHGVNIGQFFARFAGR